MNDVFSIQTLLAKVHRALLGNITPQLRAAQIYTGAGTQTVLFLAYFDGEISTDDEDKISHAFAVASKYVQKSKNGPFIIQKQISRWDYPKQLPQDGVYVYLRDESSFHDNLPQMSEINHENYRDDDMTEMAQLRLACIMALLGRVRQNLRTEQDYSSDQAIAKGDPLWPGYSCKVDVIQAPSWEVPTDIGMRIYSRASFNGAETRALRKRLKEQP